MLFVLILCLRFSLIKQNTVHYHANFAVYINGKQETFASPLYYEEVQTCSEDFENQPQHRAHMHDQVNNIVHVHDQAVTWGHFFANLGFGLTKNLIETQDGIFIDKSNGKRLTFYLNGETVDSVANKVIQSEDVLLIDYGNDLAATIKSDYDKISHSAHQANITQDPATCAGSSLTTSEKLKRTLKFWE